MRESIAGRGGVKVMESSRGWGKLSLTTFTWPEVRTEPEPWGRGRGIYPPPQRRRKDRPRGRSNIEREKWGGGFRGESSRRKALHSLEYLLESIIKEGEAQGGNSPGKLSPARRRGH